MSHNMRFPTMWYVRPAKPQISLPLRAVRSEPLLVTRIFYECKLLTEHHLEFLSLKGGRKGLSESTLVKIPHCWKSHVKAQLSIYRPIRLSPCGGHQTGMYNYPACKKLSMLPSGEYHVDSFREIHAQI